MGHVTGGWSERVNSVNTLIDCLAHPIRETARVIGAVAKGDLSQSMAMEIEGRSWRANSCAPPKRSIRWWTSSARSLRK